MGVLRQSTARTILIGPILDSEGAAKTDEVVGNIKITKNGTVGAANGSATLTHNHAGKYLLALTASDTDTVGVLEISLNSGTNDMQVTRVNVVEEAVFDAIFAASAAGYQVPIWANAASTVNLTGTTVQANLISILGTALTETSGLLAAGFKKFFNVASPTGTVNSIPDAVAGATGGLAIVGSAMAFSQAAVAQAAAVEEGTVNIRRGDTVTLAFTALGSLASRTGEKLWFTVKKHTSDVDTAAIIQIGETTGAIRVNGAATTASYGSLVVTDDGTGALTITLTPSLTSQLTAQKLSYDIQILETTTVRTLTSGSANVLADVTRATG